MTGASERSGSRSAVFPIEKARLGSTFGGGDLRGSMPDALTLEATTSTSTPCRMLRSSTSNVGAWWLAGMSLGQRFDAI